MPPTDNVISLLDAAKKSLTTGEDVRRAPAPSGLIQADEYPVVRPKDVLPHPRDLDCMASWDTETSSLYVDDGGRTAIVSVAYSLKSDPDTIHAYAFPFDQGRPKDKGFEPVRNPRGEIKVDVFMADARRSGEGYLVHWDGVHVPRGYIGYRDGRGNPLLRVDPVAWSSKDFNLPQSDWDDLMRWLTLAGRHVGLVGHNDKFDIHMTQAGTRHYLGVDLEPYVAWDSMLACKELWPTDSIALKEASSRLWGEAEAEEAREVRDALLVCKKLYGLVSDVDGPRYDLLPWSVAGPYATQDAVLTLRLTKLQTLMGEEGYGATGNLWKRMDDEMDLMRTLTRVERRGFGEFNVELATKVAIAIEKRVTQLEAALPFEPTAYRAKEYFFDDLGLRPWKGAEEPREIEYYLNKKGDRSKRIVKQGTLTVDVAARMAAQGVKFAAEYAELARLKTANQMNYRGYINLCGPDGRIRTNFKQAFVRSGRMSVERFQAQAIPRRDSVKLAELPTYDGPLPHPRDFFETPAGRKRATIDLSQAELRVAFKFSGCKLGIEQIEAGRDIHGEMATQIFDVQRGEGHAKDCYCEVCAEFSHHRYISKRGVFGGIFMVGPKTFRETIWKLAQIDLPWSTAQQTISGFRQMYPEIEAAYNDSQEFVMQHGYIELVGGVRSYFSARDFDNTAWNRKVQGSLALFNAHWLTEIERRTEQWDALVLSVHDSATLDLPEDVAEEQVAEIIEWTNAEFESWFGIVGATDCDWGY